jgi:glycolate oxidase iron-sulfur subunit
MTAPRGRRMLAVKIAAFTGLDLDFLVVVNAGGQRELTAALRGGRLRTRVVHLPQLVAMAQAVSADG